MESREEDRVQDNSTFSNWETERTVAPSTMTIRGKETIFFFCIAFEILIDYSGRAV